MPRVLLLIPTGTYRADAFVAAATRLGIDVAIGCEHHQAMAPSMGERAVVVSMTEVGPACERIAALHRHLPLDGIVAVDDQGVAVAAAASARLGLRGNPVESVLATRDKSLLRSRLRSAGLAQPRTRILQPGCEAAAVAGEVGYPCVVKPLSRSGSQGVIRADDAEGAVAAVRRTRAIVGAGEPLLVEEFIAGTEVAVEALLESGTLRVLAAFDKPDPLDGPFFEETIYVTPSGLAPETLQQVAAATASAAAALGLREGPVHAELRIAPGRDPVVVEVAARTIGGRCSRVLRFGVGTTLEEVILRHAIGVPLGPLRREAYASGVMMLPIRQAGLLERVDGQAAALAVEGVVGVEITIPRGQPLVPLPEGDRYLGFVFAHGPTPREVERALRRAEEVLDVVVRPAAAPGGGADGCR